MTDNSAAEPSASFSPRQRYFIMSTVVIGSSLYATALLTTSTVLPQMQGSLSTTQDEIAWAMTFNILATAIVTPMSGWLVAQFGVKKTIMGSMFGFSLATFLCGTAQSLEMLVLWRILQGGAGAPVIPLSQAILLNTFPRAQHASVTSLFGIAVGVAPVFGPVVGGYLAETLSWRWTFYMLVPFGLLSFIGLRAALPNDSPNQHVQFDWFGFLALAVAMTGLQLALARGVRLDWFQSTEVIIEFVIAVVAFYLFLVHCLTAKTPFLNLSLLKDRNYAVGLVLVTIYGMLNFTPMVLLPPLLQQHMGYSDALVGQIIGARGVGMSLGFLVAGLMGRFDPRLGMATGFLLQSAAGIWLMSFDLNANLQLLTLNSFVQGVAVGIVWVPMATVAFSTLAPVHRAEAASVFHLLRNIGSSIFISLSIAEIVRTTGANYSRMTEFVTPFNGVLSAPWVTGGWTFDTGAGLAAFAREIGRQAAMLGYLNAFLMYTVMSVVALLLVFAVRAPPSPRTM